MSYGKILKDIRTRIFLASAEKDVILHSTDIAKEFGLSRTPVRQIFDRLEAEHLIITRPGVGSICQALDPAMRQVDFRVLQELTLAASRLAAGSVPNDVKFCTGGMRQVLSKPENPDISFFVTSTVSFVENVANTLSSPILADAFMAARWRVTRWRVRDHELNPERFWNELRQNVVLMDDAAQSDNIAHLLRTTAGVVESTLREAEPDE